MSTIPLTDLRDRLGEFIDEVVATGVELTITKHGRPVAVVVGADEYEALIESLNIMSDRDTMDALKEARADVRENRTQEA